MQKIKYDFGIGEKPEGYVSMSDRVMQQLDTVAQTEMKRMNVQNRQGEIKFQEESGLQGAYYKETKRYEKAHPVEARAVSRGSTGERGFIGYVDYDYRVFQSARKPNRTEAAAAEADIPTDIRGRDTYRYNFGAGGLWDRQPGQPVRE